MNRCLDCKFWMRNADPIIGKCEKFGGWRFQFEGTEILLIGGRKHTIDCREFVQAETREPAVDVGLSLDEKDALRREVDRVYEKMRRDRNKERPYWRVKKLERQRLARGQ